jgi:hypothetical protein
MKIAAFWVIAPWSIVEVDRRFRGAFIKTITMMTNAVLASETSVYLNETTWHCIPEGCHLHTFRRDSLKFHKFLHVY